MCGPIYTSQISSIESLRKECQYEFKINLINLYTEEQDKSKYNVITVIIEFNPKFVQLFLYKCFLLTGVQRL